MTELKITQADREAAASLEANGRERDQILRGKRDKTITLQAFARRSIAAEEGKAELVAAVRSYLYAIDEGLDDFSAEKRLRAALARVRGEG